MTTQSKLTLVIPARLAAAPALATLLARADRAPFGSVDWSLDRCLFALFGVQSGSAGLPVAAVTRVADGGAPDGGWWLRVDPVRMVPSWENLVMLGNDDLELTMGEARALAEELVPLFAEFGGRLEVGHPKRWYLRLPTPPRLETTPLTEVVGRSIEAHLPYGDDRSEWHRLLNEVQMQLHASPINRAREGRGEPAVNSVWFWGGGSLPAAVSAPWTRVQGADPVTAGLAKLAGVGFGPVAQNADAWLASAGPGEHLVVLEPNNAEQWEAQWFAPLQRALKRRSVRQVTLVPCDGARYVATPRTMLRLWRRPRKTA